MTIRAIVTDIEGTTTSLSFVKDQLFPYAKERLTPFLRENISQPEVQEALQGAFQTIAAEEGFRPDVEKVIEYLIRWIDEDRKHPALKKIQGMIWEKGYEQGVLKGHVYPDVPQVLKNWAQKGITLAVYSSGSVQAQKLLFGNTEAGDLTELFSFYFDTAVGMKGERKSYEAIRAQLGLLPYHILFLSDVEAELDAAKAAGFHTCQVLREGVVPTAKHPRAANFQMADELLIERKTAPDV